MAPGTSRSDFESSNLEDVKLYLPSNIVQEIPYLQSILDRYLESEFPTVESQTIVHSIPKEFSRTGQEQACKAEKLVFDRLMGLHTLQLPNLWIMFFHNASYGGYSKKNLELWKLIIREHDFVVFVKFMDKHYVILMEVKSTNDRATIIDNVEVIADSKSIKNNKRSAEHQLRDHCEILKNSMKIDNISEKIQCYIMWPFLGQNTTDPKQQKVKRWVQDGNLHVFQDTIAEQDIFNIWFQNEIISGHSCNTNTFMLLLKRFVILSCGVFMDEIDKNLLALLTQEQMKVLQNIHGQRPLVVHGIAGTGKTLLILKKLQWLYENGQLNDKYKALYICYWPGLRCEVLNKINSMGLSSYVDTQRLYIASDDFLKNNTVNYKHVFVDESEATILSFNVEYIRKTFYRIYQTYHNGNCNKMDKCELVTMKMFLKYSLVELVKMHPDTLLWGELWFMVDTNQALVPLPRHSPEILKTPHIVLNRLIRSTNQICNFFGKIMYQPIPIKYLKFPKYSKEPPIFWVEQKSAVSETVAEVIIDLCSSKGVKPNDICVIPFLRNNENCIDKINEQIAEKFVENTFQPEGTNNVERYLTDKNPNEFLVAWSLLVKGLEFKVVIMVLDEEQFEDGFLDDVSNRNTIYVISSRCTCMLIVISKCELRNIIKLEEFFTDYIFDITFKDI
ncbi:hypothetical protein ABEB36_005364 [Hypothenemus hampei]|uniref:Uncharacterized protein n=1 Tax=Hypothenemus hampei TaxID=57062 RepID=A0ABD1EY02_HYPHA